MPTTSPLLRLTTVLLLGGTGLLAACGDPGGTYDIQESRTLQKPRRETRTERDSAARFGATQRAGHGGGPGPVAEAAGPEFDYDLPEGWQAKTPSSMRVVNLGVEGKPAVECYVTVLAGGGGGLRPNLDRWRAQMGMEPLTDEEFGGLPKLEMMAREAPMVELRGTYGGMSGDGRQDHLLAGVAAEFPFAGIFVKLTGPLADAEPELENFKTFCASLRMKSGGGGHGGAAQAPSVAPPMPSSGLRWTVPEGWTEGQGNRMRLVTLHPAGDTRADLSVTVLSGAAGGLEPNLNRWREQIGLEALADAEVAALPKITVLGEDVPLLEVEGAYRGMGSDASEGFALFGVVCPVQGNTVFIKLTGPVETLRAEKERFEAFCRSLERDS